MRERQVPRPLPGFGTKNVRHSSVRQKRKDDLNRSRLPLFRQGGVTVGLMTRLSSQEGSGRLHTYREVCGSDKGNVSQAGYFEYSFVEMTFVVGQGVISLLGGCRGW